VVRRAVVRSGLARPVGVRAVLAVREFRWLWAAGAQSLLGDQLARVALSVLVYSRTGSGWWTSATYALTYLPAAIGGVLFAGLADRYPRRRVMVACDVARCGLLAGMVVPGVPLPVVAILLVAATGVGAVFKAAEPALIADLFSGEPYAAAVGLRATTFQVSQLVGFAVGGIAVAGLGARAALAVDSASFAVSACLLMIGLRARAIGSLRGRRDLLGGLRLVTASPRLRLLVALAALAGIWVIPEGLAAPYAAAVHGGPAAVGVLLAANPAGNVLGIWLFLRLPRVRRDGLMGPLAVGCGLPLLVCAARPGLIVTAALWLVAGTCSAYQVQVTTEFAAEAPVDRRAAAMGVLSTSLLVTQGLGLLLGGVLSSAWSPAISIAITGATGSLLATALLQRRRQLIPKNQN